MGLLKSGRGLLLRCRHVFEQLVEGANIFQFRYTVWRIVRLTKTKKLVWD